MAKPKTNQELKGAKLMAQMVRVFNGVVELFNNSDDLRMNTNLLPLVIEREKAIAKHEAVCVHREIRFGDENDEYIFNITTFNATSVNESHVTLTLHHNGKGVLTDEVVYKK